MERRELVARGVALAAAIRPEAHWSDGVEISAQDFVFTHGVIRAYFALDKGGNLTLDRTMVRSVRALDPMRRAAWACRRREALTSCLLA